MKAHGKDETKRQFVLDDPYGFPRPIEELDELKTRPELTTLLINCYAKLKDVAALDRFVRNEDDLAVDGATAVVALRDAGYYAHAERAAEAYGEFEWRCVLALERDPWRPEEALEFFDRMDVLSRFRCVRKIRYTTSERLPRSDHRVVNEISHSTRRGGRRLRATGGREHAGLLRRRVTIKEGGSKAKKQTHDAAGLSRPTVIRTTRASRATTSRTFLSIDRAICDCFVITS